MAIAGRRARRTAQPIIANPRSIIIQVVGSGTPDALGVTMGGVTGGVIGGGGGAVTTGGTTIPPPPPPGGGEKPGKTIGGLPGGAVAATGTGADGAPLTTL